MYEVITLGSATVDVFADTASQLVKFITPEGEKDLIAYPSGAKILISDLQFLVGGGGTNTAVSFSRLGLNTAFAGKIGDDENGFKILHLLDQEGVHFIGAKEGQTGYSLVLDSIEHDRTILTFKGANNNLQEHELPKNAQASWCYLSSMIGVSFRSATRFAKQLHAQGTKIAFNPSNYQAKQGLIELSSLLAITHVLVLNKEEAELLLGKQGDCQHLATLLAQHHIPYVIITDGAKGAYCYYNEHIYHITPTPQLKVKESTGAGDAFASAFVAGLHKNYSLEHALTLGMVQAESVIQATGAKTNLLHEPEARVAMQAFAGHIHVAQAPSLAQAHDLLKGVGHKGPKAANHEPFIFASGKELLTLEELAYYLKFVSPKTFTKHLHQTTNDFALWIEHSLHLPQLAKQISQLKDQYVMSKHLIEYIHTHHR